MPQIDKIGRQPVKAVWRPADWLGMALPQLFSQNLWIGGGALADEAHAHVRRGAFVDDRAIEQEGDGRRPLGVKRAERHNLVRTEAGASHIQQGL